MSLKMNSNPYQVEASLPNSTGGIINYETPGYLSSSIPEIPNQTITQEQPNNTNGPLLEHDDGRPFRWYIRGDITEKPSLS